MQFVKTKHRPSASVITNKTRRTRGARYITAVYNCFTARPSTALHNLQSPRCLSCYCCFTSGYVTMEAVPFYTRDRNNVRPLFLMRKTAVNAQSSIARARARASFRVITRANPIAIPVSFVPARKISKNFLKGFLRHSKIRNWLSMQWTAHVLANEGSFKKWREFSGRCWSNIPLSILLIRQASNFGEFSLAISLIAGAVELLGILGIQCWRE